MVLRRYLWRVSMDIRKHLHGVIGTVFGYDRIYYPD